MWEGMGWGTRFSTGFGLWKKQAAVKKPLQSVTLGQLAGPGTAKVEGLRVVPAWQPSVGAAE